MARISLIFLLFIGSREAWSNSCCGQSPTSFTVLSLNQRLSFNVGMSSIQTQGRVLSGSDDFTIWTDKKRRVTSLQTNLAGHFADKHQAFVTTSFLYGEYKDNFSAGSSAHGSDTLVGYSYELLSEYNFSYWKPVIHLSALLNIPTGHSIYDTQYLNEGADVTGHNQWGAGIGLTIRKVYFPLTFTLQGKSIQLFSKTFNDIQVSNFYDNSASFLVNYASRLWDLGFNGGVTISHLSQRKIQPIDKTSAESQSFTIIAGAQRAILDDWVMGVSYSDQTLLGPAKNTLLNRTYSLNFNYNLF